MTEYRCLNGQCIDKIFYTDLYPDCMDHSDEKFFNDPRCFDTLDSRCEDNPCRTTWFSCGDGYCYDGPSTYQNYVSCGSQRDRLYLERMPFSTVILYSHIRLIMYNKTKPELICFNETLCPYLVNNHIQTTKADFNGLTCRSFSTFTSQTYDNFYDMIKDVKRLVRSCSLLPRKHINNQCSLFQCNDGSKCLSHHRLLDGHNDCANGEDEHYKNTCSLNLPYRFTCDNGSRCIHQALVYDFIVSDVYIYINNYI